MLKITKNPSFKTNIPVQEPIGDNRFRARTFPIEFNILARDEAQDFLDQDDGTFFKKVIKGWDQVENEEGPMVCNEENIIILTNVPFVYSAIIKVYFEEAFGGKAKRKN